MEKILFLSDLHLGCPLFKYAHKVLNLLQDDYDYVYLLGDIFDIWERDFEYIESKYSSIINSLNRVGDRLYFIIGNHDPDLLTIRKILPNANIYLDETYIFDNEYIIFHGDKYDKISSRDSIFSKIFFFFRKVFLHIGIDLKSCYRRIYSKVSVNRDRKYYNKIINKIRSETINEYKGEYAGAIIGHTHSPIIMEKDDFTFINCGDALHSQIYLERCNDVWSLKSFED